MEETKSKSKWVKVGILADGQYGEYIRLGESKSKDPKYNFDVKLMVKNSEGVKILDLTNASLKLSDPRKFKNRDGSERNVPAAIKYELVAQVKEE